MDFLEKLDKYVVIDYKSFDPVMFNDWINGLLAFVTKSLNFVKEKIQHNSEKNRFCLLLCMDQIANCLSNLARISALEIKENRNDNDSRKHFMDRMTFCLSELKSLASPDNKKDENTSQTASNVDPLEYNFASTFDALLDLLTSLAGEDTQNSNEQSLTSSNVFEQVLNVRSIINFLIGNVLSFKEIFLEKDKPKINTICKLILQKCISFEEQTIAKKENNDYGKAEQLMAAELKLVVYNLEDLLNDCILRVLIDVFGTLNDCPIKQIKDTVTKYGKEGDEVNQKIKDFDLLIDRLIQIGMLGTSYSEDRTIKLNLRSSVASLESLDSDLLPSILAGCDSSTLEQHWKEESEKWSNNIHQIIDTKTFCSCIVESISNRMEKDNLIVADLEEVLKTAFILSDHIGIVMKAFEIDPQMKDFKIMLKECRAAIKYSDKINFERIIKRFRILLQMTKKIHTSLECDKKRVVFEFDDQVEDEPQEGLESVNNEFFKSFGINKTLNMQSFYNPQLRRTNRNQSLSMIPQLPTILQSKSIYPSRRADKRIVQSAFKVDNNSSKMGKKLKMDISVEKSLNLNITAILDEITNLSKTFHH